mmetsp:Transcript_13560/g.37148  ORF Transcript_13560/g.37148 Transcript_13560/m.37148 type:complete len:222 (-) Transcript_13560:449-1114(-)
MRCNDDARSIGLPLAPPPTSLIRTISALSCAFSRTTASTRASLSLRRSSSAMFSALWPLICPSRTETCSSLRLRDRRALSRLDSILRWRRTSSVVFPPLPSPRSSSLKSSSLALLLGSKDASRLTPFFVAAGDVLPFAAALPFGAALAFFGGFLSTFGDAGATFCGMPAAARAAGLIPATPIPGIIPAAPRPAPAMPGCIAPMPAIGFMRLGTIAGATAGC